MSKKITKDDFNEIMKQTAGDLIDEALEKGAADSALAITLYGAIFGAKLAKNIFDNEEEIEIITDKE